MKKLFAVSVLFFLVLFTFSFARAETVHLKDGRKFRGKLTEKGDRVEVDTGYGRLSIPRADIALIEKDTPPARAQPAGLAKTSKEIRKAILGSITSTQLRTHVHYLASDKLEGRGTGTTGGKLARDYIVGQFKSYGLKPGGDSQTYTQKFPTALGDSWNVVGYIEGSNPVMKAEVVVVGAHYDHVGRGKDGRGEIHPGADDNASGTAGVLEIAQAITEKKIKPKRTFLFICFGAEEIGLVGSRYYCEHPAFPLEKTAAMLNMDMIARNEPDTVIIFGVTLSAQLEKLMEAANYSGMTIKKRPMALSSDHTSFYVKGVPAIFVHSGMHEDLHRPTDTPDRCDFVKAEKIAELVALTALGAADYEGKIEMEKFKGEDPWRRWRRGQRLGISPGPAQLSKETRKKFALGEEGGGILVRSVRSGSVAEKSGLKAGDIIIELNGERGSYRVLRRHLRRLIMNAAQSKEVPYTIIRNGEKKTGKLTFP